MKNEEIFPCTSEEIEEYRISANAVKYLFNESRTAVAEVFSERGCFVFTITVLVNDSFEDDDEVYSFWDWQRIYVYSGFYDTPEKALEAAAEEMRCRMLL